MANNSDQQQNPEALEFVKLISCDGFEFIVNKEVALRSGTIKNMLSSPGQFTESVQNEVVFRDIKHNTNSTTEIPEFKIDPELALETLMAADFLDCEYAADWDGYKNNICCETLCAFGFDIIFTMTQSHNTFLLIRLKAHAPWPTK
ncbi:BTB/POZ protein, partial [Jimgerdemannia flammicorona]